jgi:hypothetical protein
MVLRFLVPTIVAAVVLCSCNKMTPGSGPHATVYLRDGTAVTGTVTSSSPAELQVTGDDNSAHTIPLSQVQSISYDQAAGAPPAPNSASTPAAGEPPARDAVHEHHYHPSESSITTKTYTVPAGTAISVRNEDTIDSARAAEGQTFPAEVTRDALDDAGNVVIPRGANALIVIKSASRGGRIHGSSDLVLDLASVSVDGRQYRLNTSDVVETGKSGVGANKRTAEYAGGGAAIGAIIGAIAGHGKGAAIGAGSGAGAGALGEILTKGGSIEVPVESVLTFKLESPLRVVAAQ